MTRPSTLAVERFVHSRVEGETVEWPYYLAPTAEPGQFVLVSDVDDEVGPTYRVVLVVDDAATSATCERCDAHRPCDRHAHWSDLPGRSS